MSETSLPLSLSLSLLFGGAFASEKKQNPRSKDGGEDKKTRHHHSARVKAIVAFCVLWRERERFLQKRRRIVFLCLFRVFGLLGFTKMSKEKKKKKERKAQSVFPFVCPPEVTRVGGGGGGGKSSPRWGGESGRPRCVC